MHAGVMCLSLADVGKRCRDNHTVFAAEVDRISVSYIVHSDNAFPGDT